MKTFLDCIPCFVKQTLSTMRRITDDEILHEKVLRTVLQLISEINLNTSPPSMAQEIHRTIREMSATADPFAQEKTQHNRFVLSLIPEIRQKYRNDPDLFATMLRLSIAGNIIDLGSYDTVTKADVLTTLDRSITINMDENAIGALRSAILQAQSILYLGDNAGEIVFDRLFIELLPQEKLTYVVRGAPIINDVTIKDAQEVGMCDLVDVIDNGSDAPGTILEDCSQEFRNRFGSADLIIAKGQGNYETLSDVNKNIFFLFQVKCPVIARDSGYDLGNFIVKEPK